MTGLTIAQKIIRSHVTDPTLPVDPGDIVVVDVDTVMAQDGNAPLAIRLLREELGYEQTFDAQAVVLVIDHCGPSPNEGASNLQKMMRNFCTRSGATLFDVGQGISHVVLPENGYAIPGQIVVGSDSHSVTYGALGCMGLGMGSTDIAVAMALGQTWLRVPDTIKVTVSGELGEGCTAKDATLELIRMVGVDGATYCALEFDGPGLAGLSMDARFTMCNMAIEMGAKCALMPIDDVSRAYLEKVREVAPHRVPSAVDTTLAADAGAVYSAEVEIDLGQVSPLVVSPHDLTDIRAASEFADQSIDQAFLGTCTNSRIEDLRAAAGVLRGRTVHSGVRMIVTPGSKAVLRQAVAEGLVEDFLAANAVLTTPGCGACVGTHFGVPADGDVVISTANRNFKGRMGNPRASIYLASPETVAASAVMGRIATAAEVGR